MRRPSRTILVGARKPREIVRISEAPPEGDRSEVADFARFLLAKQEDDAWERSIADPRPRPALDKFVREARAEGYPSRA